MKLAAFALAATMIGQLGMAAFADENVDVDNIQSDPDTSVGEAAWTVLSLPVDLTAAVADGALGGLGGGLKGIVRTEEIFGANTYGKVDENPLWIIPGLIGTVVAVPVGFLVGLPMGLVNGAKYGWNMLDNMDD